MKTALPLLLALALPAYTVSAVQWIAHRGASYDAPENTLSAFKLGFEQKADVVECDIYLTKDGKIIIMHDGDTLRTTGATNKIAKTDSSVILKLPAGNWGKFQNQGFKDTVPTLEQALALVPDGKKLIIEIKTGPEIIDELQKVLKASGKKPAQTPIISFNYDSCKAAKARMPELEVSYLASADSKTKQFPPVEELIAKAKAGNLDGLDLNYGFPIDKAFVKKVHAAGLKLYTWTVDDPAIAKKEIEAGVDGITTNRPEWMRQQVAALP
jgi:glycerophosphoryl diester phosphodiesterase